jgi:heat shock protein HslJ
MLFVGKSVRVVSRVSVAAGLVLLTAACAQSNLAPSSAGNPAAATSAATAGGPWQLQSLTRSDSSTVTVSEPDRFTLQFVDADRLAIRADCNRASGGYTLSGSTLAVGVLASTKAYCSSAPFDDEFLQLLGGETVPSVTATTLVLSSSRGTLRFGR